MSLENLSLSEIEKTQFRSLMGEAPIKYLYCLIKTAIQEIKEEAESNKKNENPLLSIQELADKFKVTKATVHNWINRGVITGKKMGKGRYFDEKEVRLALDKFRHYNMK